MGRFQREAITVDLNDPKEVFIKLKMITVAYFISLYQTKRIISAEEESLFALKIPGVENTSNKDGLIRVEIIFLLNGFV